MYHEDRGDGVGDGVAGSVEEPVPASGTTECEGFWAHPKQNTTMPVSKDNRVFIFNPD